MMGSAGSAADGGPGVGAHRAQEGPAGASVEADHSRSAAEGGAPAAPAEEADEAAMEDVEPAVGEGAQRGTAPERETPGAYVRGAGSHAPSAPEAAEGGLEALIREAQELDEAEATWPLRLPRVWYQMDPKRAGRCLVRAALARDPEYRDLSFATDSAHHRNRRVRGMGVDYTLHRTSVRFGEWGHTFTGSWCGTIAMAERSAFRVALDSYSQWVRWTD